MRPGRLWWIVKRDLRRGWCAAWGDHVLRPRIWRWRNPWAGRPEGDVPVHTLTGHGQADMAAWMLATWYHHTGRNWRVVLHDDGTLTADDAQKFRSLGLPLRIVSRAEADTTMAARLATLPHCNAYRALLPLALKIFDIPVLTAAPRFILLDSDVLFFARPAALLEWVDRPADESCWFNADVADASNVPADEAIRVLGVKLWPRVNSGLCLLGRTVFDLAFCERIFTHTNINRGHAWRVEQTLFALCASRGAKGGLLPPAYEVSLGRTAASDAVARHYVGAVRDRFFGEGLFRQRRLIPRACS